MNYTALVTAICDYTENSFNYSSDPTPVNTFIAQAEQRIYNTVQFPSLRKTSTLATVASNAYLNCPNDFLSVYSLAVYPTGGEYSFLLNKDTNFLREAYPSPTDTGKPIYYALYGPQVSAETELRFMFGPTPDAVYNVELQYFYYPASIVTASTTWLGDNFDTVLLYGSLVEAYRYMKGEQDTMAYYDTAYKEALAMAKRLGDGLERSDAYRSGQYRQAVT